MSVTDLDKVDGMGLSKDKKYMCMFISDHLDWEDVEVHLRFLQDKINAYMAYLEGGEWKSKYPENLLGVEIEIAFLYDIPEICEKFLQAAQDQLGQYCVRIKAVIADDELRQSIIEETEDTDEVCEDQQDTAPDQEAGGKETVFEDAFMELHASMISLCQIMKADADKIYVCCFIGGDYDFNAFYQKNGKILRMRRADLDIDREIIKIALSQGQIYLMQIESLCREHGRPVPVQIKIIYDVKTGAMESEYQYEPVKKIRTAARKALKAWIAEVKAGG